MKFHRMEKGVKIYAQFYSENSLKVHMEWRKDAIVPGGGAYYTIILKNVANSPHKVIWGNEIVLKKPYTF